MIGKKETWDYGILIIWIKRHAYDKNYYIEHKTFLNDLDNIILSCRYPFRQQFMFVFDLITSLYNVPVVEKTSTIAY